MRAAAFLSVSTPYFRARFEGAEACFPGRLEIVSIERNRLSDEYAFRIDAGDPGPRRIILANNSDELAGRAELDLRLAEALEQADPDVVFAPGWILPDSVLVLHWAARHGKPVVLFSESSRHDEPRKAWRERIKSALVSHASAALVGGRSHAAYLESLGMPPDRIFLGYDAVDNGFFASESARWRGTQPPSPPYFLASARFVPKKNLPRLLEAYAAYVRSSGRRSKDRAPGTGETWPLVLLGDGDGKPALLAHAETLGLEPVERAPWEPGTSPQVGGTAKSEGETEGPVLFLPGFRQIEELPRFYAGAGAFVHASTTEQWGLVVNEAMASGLPVLVSERCGCVPELVREGDNGWTFDPGDVEGLAGLMARVAALPPRARSAMGEASRRLVADWGPERFAAGLMAAAEKALEIGPRRGTVLDRTLLGLLARR